MDQVRLLVAIGLSFVVLFVWSVYFVDQQPAQKPDENKVATTKDTVKSEVPQKKAAVTSIPTQEKTSDIQQMPDTATNARDITVDTPNYKVRISSKGAIFTSYVLKKYREKVNPDSPLKQLIPESLNGGTIKTSFQENPIPHFNDAVYSIDTPKNDITVKKETKYVTFRWRSPDGIVISKTYGFDPNSYLIHLNVTISNNTQHDVKNELGLSVRKPVEKERGYGFVGPSVYLNGSLDQIKTKKIEDQNEYKGKIEWIGVEDRYFLSSIIPDQEMDGRIKLSLDGDIVTNELISPAFDISPGTQKELKYLIFMGPKSMKLLDHLGHNLGEALNFGFFNIIAKPCLWFMNQIYSVIPNYGIAIIILTIFTKIILWPLGTKSYKSMNEMKKLQPLMADIREKYKDDKQKMNQELMSLYRTYKINPMGGCLPMVLQIPVFFALYRMLYQAIELRHAPFFLWINDLSAPDRLFHFNFSIPFMQPPYGIPVLTIIMGATMLLQQKMSPPPGDPTQAKMMMLMPVVFTFIFINFSSGLVLYWLVNNVLSISQQYYVQKKAK